MIGKINKSSIRGKTKHPLITPLRKKDRRQTSPIPPVEEDLTHYQKQCRSAWARLIRKIYEVEPLVCPRCKHTMRILAFVVDDTTTIIYI